MGLQQWQVFFKEILTIGSCCPGSCPVLHIHTIGRPSSLQLAFRIGFPVITLYNSLLDISAQA